MRTQDEAADRPSRVQVETVEEIFRLGEILALEKAEIQFERFDGSMSEPIQRVNFDRSEAVGVLLVNPRNDSVFLVRQFRYPAYAHLARQEDCDPRDAWLLEIVAGIRDSDLDLIEIARKELLEEAGFTVSSTLQELVQVYPSPGGSSELITLFRADVEPHDRLASGGGVVAEGEDIRVVEISLCDALDMIRTGAIRDAKTIIALQHLALENRSDASPS